MDIIDSQVHVGPGRIEEALAVMDALGIRGVMIDEYWMGSARGDPGYPAPNGAFRPIQPTAELAAILHPDRFSYLVRVDRRDREVQAIIRMAADAPYARALRITPGMLIAEAEAFAAGAYDSICAAANDCGLPLFIFAPSQAQVIARIARAFPSLRVIFDHCGLISNPMRSALGQGDKPHTQQEQLAAFDEVLGLAELPNVALKWAHAPAMFEAPAFPADRLGPMLRRAIDRFGAERVMWASDITANQTGESWAELLFSVLTAPGLSQADREAVLGRTARAWLNWPA